MTEKQKTVLITGASSGMGRATARYLAGRGYLVYAASRTPEKLVHLAGTIFPIQMDITDSQSVSEAIELIERIDILINNAGYGLVATVEEVTEAQMLSQFDVNLFGLLRVTRAVIPKIRVHSLMPGFFDTNFARENLMTNEETFSEDSPYREMVSGLAPVIVEQINHASEVAELIQRIIEDETSPARQTTGDKAQKFIPMRRELSDEDFERRVREYYRL